MQKFKCLIILVLCTLSYFDAHNQNLKIFTKPDSTNQFYKIQNFDAVDSLDIIDRLRKLQMHDISDGYLTAGFDSIVFDSGTALAYYSRGNKYFWKSFYVEDSNELVINRNYPISNSVFDAEEMFNSLEKTISLYSDIGYPFASISVQRFYIDSDSIIADLIVNAGQYFVFDSIIIKGDVKIKPYYIYKVSNLKKDEVFSFSKIESAEKLLNTVPFIEQTRSFQLAFGDGKADMLIYLRNRKSGSFSGLIGILPNNKTTGKVLITGDLNLNLINAAGVGEYILFKWQKFESLSQKLETEFSVPYLFKSDFGIGFDFDLEKKDTSWLNTDFTSRILYGSNTLSGFDLFYRNKSSYLLGDIAGDNQGFKSGLYGVGLRYIATDDWNNPSKGFILKISSAFGTRTTEVEDIGKKVMFQTRNSVDFTSYIPIGEYFIFRLRSNTSSIYSKEISENETDRIGGLNSIRGFDELSLPATSYSVANIELRYRFEAQSALFLFYDAAYFEKRNTVNNYYNYAMGTGAGIDLNTNAGIFSLVFAVGKQNESAFLFNAAKIHFGYRNVF